MSDIIPSAFSVWDTILSQYANSPALKQLIANANTYLDPAPNIVSFFDLVWNVDTAVGWGLDVWGRIVGVSRVLQISTVDYLGFTGPIGASGITFNNGIWYNGQSVTTGYALLDDPNRQLILAKAAANISDATIPSINQILLGLFGPGTTLEIPGNNYVSDGLDMTIAYNFGSALTPIQTAIIYQSGVIPRPCGVLATVVA